MIFKGLFLRLQRKEIEENVNIGNTIPTPTFSINDKLKATTITFYFFNTLIVKVLLHFSKPNPLHNKVSCLWNGKKLTLSFIIYKCLRDNTSNLMIFILIKKIMDLHIFLKNHQKQSGMFYWEIIQTQLAIICRKIKIQYLFICEPKREW